MLEVVQNYLPIINSEAGFCLTAENWQEADIRAITFYIDTLLLKPGFDFLKKIQNVSQYMAWHGTTILNATRCLANKEGIFTLRSPYDGSRLQLHYFQLVELINLIKPAAVILPPKIVQQFPEIWKNWDETILPFFAVEDLAKQELHGSYGVYVAFNQSSASNTLLEQLKRWSHLPRYVMGDFSLDLMRELKNKGIKLIETDQPATMAMHGTVLCGEGTVQLTDSLTAMQFETIDADCRCPTCSQQLTKAYLHHLYAHTPLLCQRFLIQHNVYYAQNYLGN